MSRDFEEVVLNWKGTDYRIPPDQVLPCIARIENVLSYADLAQMALGHQNISRLSMAFGVTLRMAGADVTDKEVRDGMFSRDGKDTLERVHRSLFVLMSMMIPPKHLRAEPAKKPEATGKRAASSPQRTGSSSAKAG